MSGFQSPITIKEAMDRIFNRKYLLPSFQREYVWDPQRVIDLFDSLMQKFPINSMLFWEVSEKSNTVNSFEFYDFLSNYIECHKTYNEPTSAPQEFYAVLDGQQRLTSLYIGLYGSYAYHQKYKSWDNNIENFPPRHLYLNLDYVNNLGNAENENSQVENNSEVENSDNMYKFDLLRDDCTEKKEIYIDNKDDKWFKVGDIIKFQLTEIFSFTSKYNLTPQEVEILMQLYDAICVKTNINYYLENTVDPNQAVKIFVRINSGGKPLSLSDILLSLTIAGWNKINAKKEFHNLSDSVSGLGFNINHDYILKSYLCLFHSSVKYQISSFTPAFLNTMEDNWDELSNNIIELFKLLKGFGLDNSTIRSYNATIPILYYIYHNHSKCNYATAIAYESDRKEVKKWLLKTFLYGSFGASADSILQKSIKNLKSNSNFPAKQISANIGQPTVVDPMWLDELLDTQKDSPNAFSILSLLYTNCNFSTTKFDKDHMHPYSKYQIYHQKYPLGKDMNAYNSIVNLQLLEESENRSKGDMDLDRWVKSIKSTRPNIESETYIPKVSLLLDDFDTFYEERKKMLRAALNAELV